MLFCAVGAGKPATYQECIRPCEDPQEVNKLAGHAVWHLSPGSFPSLSLLICTDPGPPSSPLGNPKAKTRNLLQHLVPQCAQEDPLAWSVLRALLSIEGPRPEPFRVLGSLEHPGCSPEPLGCLGSRRGSPNHALLTPQFPMGPGSDGPMGGMGGMEPHHMNGSLGKPAPVHAPP